MSRCVWGLNRKRRGKRTLLSSEQQDDGAVWDVVSSGEQGAARTVARASSRQNGGTEYSAALAPAPSNNKTLVLI